MNILRKLFITVLTLSLLAFPVPLSHAETAPTGMGFECAAYDATKQSARCLLVVPADVIGAEMNIDVPSAQIRQLTGLKESSEKPTTGVFFKLNNIDQGSKVILEAHYANISASSATALPFALFEFELLLSSPTLPLTIPATLQPGSKLFSAASLFTNQPSFLSSSTTPLPIVITGTGAAPRPTEPAPTTPTTTAPATTTTTTGGGGSSGGKIVLDGLKGAADTLCFDDPTSSMTDQEWAYICEAKRRGIISGNPRPEGIFFYPNEPINRAEAVKIVTLGVLRSLGKLTDADFDSEERGIRDAFRRQRFITYEDVKYDSDGTPPWFAVYINIGTANEIVEGYKEDNTYRPANKINNAESYRIIVEAGRVASEAIGDVLRNATRATRREAWFMKYASTFAAYGIDYSTVYAAFTTRKEFLILVMKLLGEVGL